MTFPQPINIPDEVFERRQKRKKEILLVSAIGIIVRLLIVILEIWGYYKYQSLVLLTDGLASLLDIITTLFFIYCIRQAVKPPDHDHPFGHGRIEPLGGLFLGALLILVGGVLIVQQLTTLYSQEFSVQVSHSLLFIPLLSIIGHEACYRLIHSIAQKQHSPSLAVEAYHFRVDALNSVLALLVLIAAIFMPWWGGVIDSIGALVIAVIMGAMGVQAVKENVDQLMDKKPDEAFFTLVREASMNVEGVLETEKIRIQHYGPDAHIDIDIEVDPNLIVHDAHIISQKVRVEIQKAWPSVRDVTVHIEPYYEGDH